MGGCSSQTLTDAGPMYENVTGFYAITEKVMLGFCCYLLLRVCFAPLPRRLQYPWGGGGGKAGLALWGKKFPPPGETKSGRPRPAAAPRTPPRRAGAGGGGGGQKPVWTLWRRKSRSCEESNCGDTVAWSVH